MGFRPDKMPNLSSSTRILVSSGLNAANGHGAALVDRPYMSIPSIYLSGYGSTPLPFKPLVPQRQLNTAQQDAKSLLYCNYFGFSTGQFSQG